MKDGHGFARRKTAMMTTLVTKTGACKDADDYNEDNDDVNKHGSYDDDEEDNNKNDIMPFLDDEDNNRSYYTITCFQSIFELILSVVFMG